MGRWNRYTPDGVQDILPDLCREKRELEQVLRAHLIVSGYSEIETPAIEFFDVFDNDTARIPQETMFKFFDRDGRILVLRPDFTVPVARMAATRLTGKADYPARLFYIGDTFRFEESGGGKKNQFTQAGLELLGAGGVRADAEVIAQAVECLKKAGLKEFRMDIGQVEFFKAIMQEAGFSPSDMEEVRKRIDRKDDPGLRELACTRDMDPRIRELVLKLPHLCGSPDLLDSLREAPLNERASRALDNLAGIFGLLKGMGLSDSVSMDLGMVSSLQYYTGMIFKGFTRGIGYPVLSGGRYDSLMGTFGRECPATGFSIGINLLMTARDKAGRSSGRFSEKDANPEKEDNIPCGARSSRTEFLVAWPEAESMAGLLSCLREQGRIAEADIMGMGPDEALAYAKARGIPWVLRLNRDRRIEAIRSRDGCRRPLSEAWPTAPVREEWSCDT